MCGIAGFNWNNSQLITKMNQSLRHRGPDDEGVYLDEQISLGHRRLSILDLSKQGHQPMFNDDETRTIIFNGEVYNYIEIREELIALGYSFNSTSDTEVLLKAYLQWGEDCLSRFNGMFAFCIYDILGKKLFLARDRLGIKPLYYFYEDGKFIFASEIKAILCYGMKRMPNDKLIYDYLMYNIVDHTDETFFLGIMKLPKAHYSFFDLETKDLTLKRYWNIFDYTAESNLDYEDAVKKFESLFKDCVQIRLRSDVPVGSCFSGGLDSSSIISVVCRLLPKAENISTFSATYPGFKRDESYYIDKQVKLLGIKNEKIQPTAGSLREDIEKYIYCQEEPTRSTSQYAQYCVMKLAHQSGYKVLLDGQGSDEMLSGYHYFFGYYFYELLKSFDLITLIQEYMAFRKGNGSDIGLKSAAFMLVPDLIKRAYLDRRSPFLNPAFGQKWGKKSEYLSKIVEKGELKGALIAHVLYKLEELLKWEDRNSMAFSIETRLPFLDYRLVQFAMSLPAGYVIRTGKTKAILREAMRDYVDEEILERTDKIGFEAPEDEWLRQEPLQDFINGIIKSESFKSREYFHAAKVAQEFQAHIDLKKNAGMKILQCVFLELWLRKFIDASGAE
jgi:asparagine synthase (glutamine-hydrolysing)